MTRMIALARTRSTHCVATCVTPQSQRHSMCVTVFTLDLKKVIIIQLNLIVSIFKYLEYCFNTISISEFTSTLRILKHFLDLNILLTLGTFD